MEELINRIGEVYEPFKVHFLHKPVRPLAPDEVLVKVRASAICGSDLHIARGLHPSAPLPVTIGHEFSGDVVAIGSEVTKAHLGERVTVEPCIVCGKCDACRHGQYGYCEHISFTYRNGDGAMADYVVVKEPYVYELPDYLSYETGALIEPLSVATHAVRRADIRLVSATHRPLKRMIAEGTFRQDLYFRINTFPIAVPPLREREGDLPLLIDSLLERVAPKRRLALSPAALRVLCAYSFPGNVRELRNVLERASLMCDGDLIGPEHLPEEVLHPELAEADDFGSPASRPRLATGQYDPLDLEEVQRQAMLRAVRAHRGSRRELARRLGISERTLYRRLRELGLLDGQGDGVEEAEQAGAPGDEARS